MHWKCLLILISLMKIPENSSIFTSDISNLKKTAIAIADIIDELASEKFMRFNIVIYGNNSKFPLFCNEIIKRSNPPVEVQVFSGEDEMRYDMNIPRVILASSRVKFSKEMY